ncbi:AsmA family protein [Spiribacter halobius]|uniref:AsmA domain-containing protein n=1 Tax=Sediminicurvatus halobius TaxID=2182432 RepID=A0A2U2MVZ3_9GAMM|nr:AsmA family protein [Spiribacter halobius]PWG60992.1 hypothetical protein DEM34_18755 [Spiribacter halobius]UEX77615.1 AsmA family protein [Spiribacter halobius]
MAGVLKWLAIIVGAVVALVVVLVVGLLLLVDPNDYRDEIAQVVEAQTGREFTIEGDIELTFFPRIGLAVGGVALGDDPAFSDGAFLRADGLNLAVEVMPLLSGTLQLDTITLRRPQVTLIRDEQGRGNWESLAPPAAAAASEPARNAGLVAVSSHEPAGTAHAGGMLADARLAGLRIEQARLVYEDRGAGTSATLDPVNLALNDVQLGAPVAIEGDWQGDVAGTRLDGTLTGSATVSPDFARASAEGLTLAVTAAGDAVPAGEQTATLSTDIEADLQAAVYRLSGLRLEAATAVLEGGVEANAAGSSPVVTGQLTLAETDPQGVFEALDMAPPETRDGNVLQSLSAELALRFAQGVLRVDPIRAKLDDSNLTGWAEVRDFAGPDAAFDLQLDGINVDSYLPPPEEGEAEPAATPGGAAAAGAELIPVEVLRPLVLDGEIRIGEITASGARLSALTASITAADGRLRVHPLTATLYGGSYQGDLRIDATGEPAVVQVNERLSGVQAAPLLSDLAGFDRLLGQGDFSLQATTRAGSVEQLLETLNGEATFRFADGAIRGINIARTLRTAMAQVQGQDTPAATEETPSTDFTQLNGSMRIEGGVVRSDDLALDSPLLRVRGSGSANLVRQEVDYRLTVNVVGSLEGQGGASLEQLRGVPIPLRISGPLTAPEVGVDIAGALRNAQEQRLREETEEGREELEQRLEEESGEIQERLRGLFNR